jgi:hypothetical protein
MKYLFFSAALAFLGLGLNAHAASTMYEREVDQASTTMMHCQIDPKKAEPSGKLTYKIEGESISKPIYSDLCFHSAQWITLVYLNADRSEVVGLALGNAYLADGQVFVSKKWLTPK